MLNSLNSPYRYIALIAACSVVMVTGFLAGALRPVYSSLPLLSLCFLSVVVAAIGMYWTSFMLREDVRNERWPEDILAPIRAVTTHVLWTTGLGLLAVAMIFAAVHNRHHPPYSWIIFFLLQTQTQITNAVPKPRKPTTPGARINWTQFSPLHSEHWGKR